MSDCRLIRLSGLACVVGGLCLASFVLVHPWDQLLGAQVARTPAWRIAHGLHFIGAAFALLGLPGLFALQRDSLSRWGALGFVLSLLGNAMFLGTGMITAFIWPMLAFYAPLCVGIGGPIFGSPLSLPAFSLTAALFISGYSLFGFATLAQGYAAIREPAVPEWRTSRLVLKIETKVGYPLTGNWSTKKG